MAKALTRGLPSPFTDNALGRGVSLAGDLRLCRVDIGLSERVLDNCRERDRDRQHMPISSVVFLLHHLNAPSGADLARVVHSGTRDMNPKGMRITMKKIVSAVEQFLQSGASWKW